ncbi:MAG: DUF4288 domain-containing protein [Planctomycetes bacterium]|nr:DUF4288 domain-containing protein [Planctomycetota bacterium]
MEVSVHLAGRTASSLARFAPGERLVRLRKALAVQSDRLVRAFPEAELTRTGEDEWTLEGTFPARRLGELAARREVESLWLLRIEGLRAKARVPELHWFCVWGIVAIQVEGRSRGPATVEDRLVLVKAREEKDAKRRLRSEWAAYAAPYLNVRGDLVRWKLIEIQGVYGLLDREIDPRGTEVFSRLRSERMTSKHRWSGRGHRARKPPPRSR